MKNKNARTLLQKLLFLFIVYCVFTSLTAELSAQNKLLNFTNSKDVRDVVLQNDNLWIATGGGLLKMNLETKEIYEFNTSNSRIPSNNISRLCTDNTGNLWVGTLNAGLVVFDGLNWKSYINDKFVYNNINITSLCADSDGIIWIGTEMGVYRYYDGSVHGDLNIQGCISDIIEDNNGAIWFGTSSGLSKFYNCKLQYWGQLNKPLPFFNVSNLAVGKENNICIVAKEGLIYSKDSLVNKINIDSIDFPYNLISSIAVDSENNLWLTSPYGRIAKYDGINFEIFNSKNSELLARRINKIKVDDSGTVWACTDNGLYLYKDIVWNFIDTRTSIINMTQSLKIFPDNDKNIWFVDGWDLYFFGKDTIAHYDQSNSKFKGAYSIAEDKMGKLWIGHSKGLTVFDGTRWQEFDTLETILLNRDREIFERYKDTVWVKENFKHYLIDTNSIFDAKSFVTNLTFDNTGNLWFRTSNALINYDGSNWALYDTSNSGIRATNISDMAIDSRNNLWIGTNTNGLMKFTGTEWITYDSTNGLLGDRINSVSIYNDSVFVSLSNGASLFDGNNWHDVYAGARVSDVLKNNDGSYLIIDENDYIFLGNGNYGYSLITPNPCVPNNFIQSICFDYSGNLWVLSNGEVIIINEEGIREEEKIKGFFKSSFD